VLHRCICAVIRPYVELFILKLMLVIHDACAIVKCDCHRREGSEL